MEQYTDQNEKMVNFVSTSFFIKTENHMILISWLGSNAIGKKTMNVVHKNSFIAVFESLK